MTTTSRSIISLNYIAYFMNRIRFTDESLMVTNMALDSSTGIELKHANGSKKK